MFRQLFAGSGRQGTEPKNRADHEIPVLPDGHYACHLPFPEPAPGDSDDGWIRIVPIGEFPFHHDGPHALDAEAIGEMARNFADRATDLSVDIDHRSLWGDTASVGWIDEVEARDDGLYAKYPVWTPGGEALVHDRTYRYFSPVYYRRTGKDGLDMGWALDSVALTNRPFFDQGEIDHIGNASPAADSPEDQDTTMDREELAQLLGIDVADVTDEVIANSIKELKANQKPAPDAPATDPDPIPEAKEAGDGDPVAIVNSRLEALEKAQADQVKEAADARAESLVDSAIANGKILPADRAVYLNGAKSDYDQTKAALDAKKANSAMPEGVQTPGGPSADPALMSRSDRALGYVNSIMGARA